MTSAASIRMVSIRTVAILLAAGVTIAAQQPANTNLGKDANGNSLRLATKTGHVSNYDESKVKPYTLPDPLMFADGGLLPTRTRGRRAGGRN